MTKNKCAVCGKRGRVKAYGKDFCSWACATKWLEE